MKSLVWNFEHQTINIFRETSWQSSWKQLLNWGEMILVDSIDCGMHAAFDLDLHCITDLVNFLMFRVNCDKSLSCWTLKRIEATVYNATGRNLPCSFILNLCIFYFGKWTDDNDADKLHNLLLIFSGLFDIIISLHFFLNLQQSLEKIPLAGQTTFRALQCVTAN